MLKLLMFLLLFPSVAFGLSPLYKDSLDKAYRELMYANPTIKYVWGMDKPYQGKADCSGLITGLWRRAAIPGITRTTALRMQQNKEGWYGREIKKLEDLDSTDLLWWTWTDTKGKPLNKDRPHGHVGMLVYDPLTGLLQVFHASASKKKAVVQRVYGQMLRDISSKQRMLHGEPKSVKD